MLEMVLDYFVKYLIKGVLPDKEDNMPSLVTHPSGEGKTMTDD
jgi:hypothetical protein